MDSVDDDGNTFLMTAAKCGNVDLVNYFLKKSAKINCQNVKISSIYINQILLFTKNEKKKNF